MKVSRKVKEMEFIQFCKVRKWSFMKFARNKRNSAQFIGSCIDDMGQKKIFIITEENYYLLLGNRKYIKYDYVLKGDEDEA